MIKEVKNSPSAKAGGDKQKSRPKADQPLAEKIKNKEETDNKKNQKKVSSSAKSSEKSSSREPQTMEELLAQNPTQAIGLKKGDTVTGAVVSTSSREILVDIGKKSFGIVAEWELEQVKDFAAQLKISDQVIAQVMNPENDAGYVVLSLRRSSNEHRWTLAAKLKDSGEDITVNVLEQTRGGLLVDWQNLRGFIPSTQLEGAAASNPGQLIGRTITVKILEVDKAVNRLVLSQRASVMGVTPLAQREKIAKINPQDTLKGKVSGVAPFGIFVDIDGIEGLVHISEIAWEKVDNPSSLYKVGDPVEVLVLDVNKDEGKLNLSIKRLTPDPWKNILDRYPVEAHVTGKVVRSAPYGLFVQLEPGVEGLLHVSKITPGEEPKTGETIECVIEHIDPNSRKISLTLVPKAKPVGYR